MTKNNPYRIIVGVRVFKLCVEIWYGSYFPTPIHFYASWRKPIRSVTGKRKWLMFNFEYDAFERGAYGSPWKHIKVWCVGNGPKRTELSTTQSRPQPN